MRIAEVVCQDDPHIVRRDPFQGSWQPTSTSAGQSNGDVDSGCTRHWQRADYESPSVSGQQRDAAPARGCAAATRGQFREGVHQLMALWLRRHLPFLGCRLVSMLQCRAAGSLFLRSSPHCIGFKLKTKSSPKSHPPPALHSSLASTSLIHILPDPPPLPFVLRFLALLISTAPLQLSTPLIS